jgi:hypothetical protein
MPNWPTEPRAGAPSCPLPLTRCSLVACTCFSIGFVSGLPHRLVPPSYWWLAGFTGPRELERALLSMPLANGITRRWGWLCGDFVVLRAFRGRIQESDRIYRVRSDTILVAISMVVLNGLAISIVVTASGRLFYIVIAILCAVATTVLLARLLWAGIFTSPKGVHVANVFGSFDD